MSFVYMGLGWVYNGDVREQDEKRSRVRDRIQRVRVSGCKWSSMGRVQGERLPSSRDVQKKEMVKFSRSTRMSPRAL